MGHIVSGYGVMGVFCQKCLLVNRASQVTLHDLEPAGTGTAEAATCNSLCSQLSGSVSCGWQWQFQKPTSSTDQCKLKAIS